MLEFLNNLDGLILLFLNSFHTDFMDDFMKLFTGRYIWIPFYLALFGGLIRSFGIRRALIYLAAVGLAVAMADQLCAGVLRPMFCRLRPSNPENPISQFIVIVDGYRGGRYGFPLCHAANSMALAMAMSVICRNRKITYVVMGWTALNCYTRLYLGVHYPGDILVGLMTGAVIGVSCGKLASLYASRIRGRMMPGVAVFSLASIPGTHVLGFEEVCVRPWHIPATVLSITMLVIIVLSL